MVSLAEALGEVEYATPNPAKTPAAPTSLANALGDDEFSTKTNSGDINIVKKDTMTSLADALGDNDFAPGKVPESQRRGRVERSILGVKRNWESFALDTAWDEARGEKDPIKREELIKKLKDEDTKFNGKWAMYGDLGLAGDVGGVMGGMLHAGVRSVDDAAVGAGTALAAGFAGPQALIPEEFLTIPFGTKIGFSIGSAKEWKKQGAGEMYREMINSGVKHETAAPIADAAGWLYAGIEFSQLSKMMPGAKKIVGETIEPILKSAAQLYVKDLTAESLEEGLQGVVTAMAEDLGKMKEKGMTNEQIMAQFAKDKGKYAKVGWDNFIVSIPSLAILGAPGAAIDTKTALDKKVTDATQTTEQPAQPETPPATVGPFAVPNAEAIKEQLPAAPGETTGPLMQQLPEEQQREAEMQEIERMAGKEVAMTIDPQDLMLPQDEDKEMDLGIALGDTKIIDPKMDEAFAAAENKSSLTREVNGELITIPIRYSVNEKGMINLFADKTVADKQGNLVAQEGADLGVTGSVTKEGKAILANAQQQAAQQQAAPQPQIEPQRKQEILQQAAAEFTEPLKLFKNYIAAPQSYMRNGAMATRKIAKAIYVEPVDGKMPPDAKMLQRTFGIQFTINDKHPNAVHLDKALEAFNEAYPNNKMTRATFMQRMYHAKDLSNAALLQENDKADNESASEIILPQSIDKTETNVNREETISAVHEEITGLKDALNNIKEEKDYLTEKIVQFQEMLGTTKHVEGVAGHIKNYMSRLREIKDISIPRLERKIEEKHEVLANIKKQELGIVDIPDPATIPDPDAPAPHGDTITYLHGGLGGIMSQEQMDIVNQKYEEFHESSRNKFLAAIDVVYLFQKIGAAKTGEAFKTLASRTALADEDALDFVKEILPYLDKIKNRTSAEIAMIAEGSIEAKTAEEKELHDIFKKYMDKYFEILKKNKLLEDSPMTILKERLAMDNAFYETELNAINDMKIPQQFKNEKKLYYSNLIAKNKEEMKMLNLIEYVPMAHAVKMSILRHAEEAKLNNKSSSYFEKGKFSDFREIMGRKSLGIKDLYDRGILNDDDVNLAKMGAYYIRYVTNKLAEKNVIDTAIADGLISTKPRNDFVRLTPRFSPGLKGLYANKMFSDYLSETVMLLNQHTTSAIKKITAWIKMKQFFNPVFVPMLNLQQATMLGVLDPRGIKNLPTTFKRAIDAMTNRTEEYQQAMLQGISSVPDQNPMSNFNKELDGMIKNHGLDLNTRMFNYIMKYLTFKENPLKVIDDIYQASYKTTWFLDRFTRFVSFFELRDRGFSIHDAAQMTASAFGDYAGVPIKTRRWANQVFFTPTYKIAMTKFYAQGLNAMYNQLNTKTPGQKAANLKASSLGVYDSPEKAQKHLGQVPLWIGAMIIGKHLFMKANGFKTEEMSRKYAKVSYDESGKKKEINITWATAFNIPLRYYYRFFKPDPSETNLFQRFGNGIMYEFNPLWTVWYKLLINRADDGMEIFNKDDLPRDQVLDVAKFLSKEVYAILDAIPTNTKKDREMRTLLENSGKELMLKILSIFAYTYPGQIDSTKIGLEMQRIQRDFLIRTKNNLASEDPRAVERKAERVKRFKAREEMLQGRREEAKIQEESSETVNTPIDFIKRLLDGDFEVLK